MRKVGLYLAILGAGWCFSGCDKSSNKSNQAAPVSGPINVPPPIAGTPANPILPPAPVGPGLPSAPYSPSPAPAVRVPTVGAPTVDMAKVQPMLQKVKDDVAKSDWVDGDIDLRPLEQMRDNNQLTGDLSEQVTALRKSVNVGKSLPSMGH